MRAFGPIHASPPALSILDKTSCRCFLSACWVWLDKGSLDRRREEEWSEEAAPAGPAPPLGQQGHKLVLEGTEGLPQRHRLLFRVYHIIDVEVAPLEARPRVISAGRGGRGGQFWLV